MKKVTRIRPGRDRLSRLSAQYLKYDEIQLLGAATGETARQFSKARAERQPAWADLAIDFARMQCPRWVMASPQLSIVIPAYNESARIEQTLDRVMGCVEKQGWDAEVLVVDDGSTDATPKIVHAWMERYPQLHLIQNEGNRGKGYSVRNGLLQATGEVVMFTDADLSAPMEEAELLLAAIADGADVAIGSRWMDKTRQTIHQPLYRKFFGRCFNWVTRVVMGLPFKDTQCGFKAFRRPIAQVIFRLQRIERWGFDPEILFIARKLGYDIREVPVTWGHDERSRMSYLRDGMKMLEEMAIIRGNSVAGRYDEAIAALKDTSTMVTEPVSRVKVNPRPQAHG